MNKDKTLRELTNLLEGFEQLNQISNQDSAFMDYRRKAYEGKLEEAKEIGIEVDPITKRYSVTIKKYNLPQ